MRLIRPFFYFLDGETRFSALWSNMLKYGLKDFHAQKSFYIARRNNKTALPFVRTCRILCNNRVDKTKDWKFECWVSCIFYTSWNIRVQHSHKVYWTLYAFHLNKKKGWLLTKGFFLISHIMLMLNKFLIGPCALTLYFVMGFDGKFGFCGWLKTKIVTQLWNFQFWLDKWKFKIHSVSN